MVCIIIIIICKYCCSSSYDDLFPCVPLPKTNIGIPGLPPHLRLILMRLTLAILLCLFLPAPQGPAIWRLSCGYHPPFKGCGTDSVCIYYVLHGLMTDSLTDVPTYLRIQIIIIIIGWVGVHFYLNLPQINLIQCSSSLPVPHLISASSSLHLEELCYTRRYIHSCRATFVLINLELSLLPHPPLYVHSANILTMTQLFRVGHDGKEGQRYERTVYMTGHDATRFLSDDHRILVVIISVYH